MRRFDYDENEDYREDVDKFFGGENEPQQPILTPEEYKALVEEEQAMQQMQIGLIHRDLNHRLLTRVTRMLEKSFYWKFYSLDTRLKMIEQTYKRLKKLEEE